MIKVGLAGSTFAVNRHITALQKIHGISVSTQVNDTSISALVEEIICKSDVMILTDPGEFYMDLAIQSLRRAKHVFLYPSVVPSTDEMHNLIKLAREANVILKCGRTGSFGIQSFIKLLPDLNRINMIEFQHIIRYAEMAVKPPIRDIILGDIEIINALIPARNNFIRAKGLNLFTCNPEIINARLEFDNGSAFNYYCNTLGTHNEHSITLIFQDSMLKYSLNSNELSGWRVNRNQNENPIFIENIQLEQSDHLFEDLYSFFNLILSGPAFLSIYDNGFESFVLTDRILEKVSKTLVQYA